MATVKGDDVPDGGGRLNGFGVLGTAVQPTSGAVPVHSVGVWGVVGSPTDIATEVDDVQSKAHQSFTAAVAGTMPTKDSAKPDGVGHVAEGFLAGIEPRAGAPAGVFGRSADQGVVGLSTGPAGLGVLGMANQSGTDLKPESGGSGVLGSGYIGVRAETQTGTAILARTFGEGLAGFFQGRVRIDGEADITGLLRLNNRDLCERFEVSADGESGSVMVIGENARLAPCEREYDKRAVGVVSGAGTLKPAITLGDGGGTPGRTQPIAMVGTVFCLVDADKAPIEAGDLLTTSETRGHAMKAAEPSRCTGAIIGKALAPMRAGRGLIPIVVTLQ